MARAGGPPDRQPSECDPGRTLPSSWDSTASSIVPGLSPQSLPSRRAAARRFHARALRPGAWPRDRRHLSAMLLSDAVQAVDALQLARPRRPLAVDVDVGTRIPPPPNGVVRDSATLARLRRSIDAAMPPPDEVKPKSALRELLRTDDVYGIQKNLTVVPYVEEHLRIARRPLRPQDVATLVSPDAAEKIRDPYKWIVKDEASLVADCDSGKP